MLSSLQAVVKWGVFPLVVVGSHVANHGSGSHANATMPVGSVAVRIGGVPVIFQGCVATCGHIATGSSTIDVGG